MEKIILSVGLAFGLTTAVIHLAEQNYQQAVTYTINVAESDGDIVWAMGQYGFDLENPFDDISEADKIEALFSKED
jgi:hypothetical protein